VLLLLVLYHLHGEGVDLRRIHSSPIHTLQALLLKTSNLSIHSSPVHTLQGAAPTC